MVQIPEATLREGEQTPGVYFDGHVKLAIANLLDKVGVQIIEAGHLAVSPEISEAVRKIAQRPLSALVGAHARSTEQDVNTALEAGVDFLGIFYCVSEARLNRVFKSELHLHAGVPIPVNHPIIGKNAVTHCAGGHAHAATQNPLHYQSLEPKLVGREMDICLDHMSGISSVKWALDKIEVEADDALAGQILQVVKTVGRKGRAVGLHELPHIVEWCHKTQMDV